MSSGNIAVHPHTLTSSGEALRKAADATRSDIASVQSVVTGATPLLAIPLVEAAVERYWQRYSAILQLSTEVLDEIAHDVGASAANYKSSDAHTANAFNQNANNTAAKASAAA